MQGLVAVPLVSLAVGLAAGYVGRRYEVCFVTPIRKFLLAPLMAVRELRYAPRDFLAESVVVATFTGSLLAYSALTLLGVRLAPAGITLGRGLAVLAGGVLLGYSSAKAGGCPFKMHWRAGAGERNSWYYLLGFYLGILYYYLFLSDILKSLL